MRRALVLAASVLACTPNGSGEVDTGDMPGTTGDEIPQPAFLNPAVGQFHVDTHQLAPELLVVERVLPGYTQILLDGDSLGTLEPGSPLGTLTDDELSLTVHGALVAGKHSLQLLNQTPDGPLTSVTLTMEITRPFSTDLPTWHTELAATDLTGSALLAAGTGTAHLLGVIAPGDPDPVLQLLRAADDGGWTVADPISVPLDGHVPATMSQTPSVSAVALPPPDDAAPARMRVAFSVGLPGAAIATRDIVLDPTPEIQDVSTAFDLDAALAGQSVEWAALGRPFALGQTVIAELTAAADTEVPHPGDRRLVASFWRGDELQWTPPAQVGMPSPTDLDALGPALVVPELALASASTLSVRLGGAYFGRLDAADDGTITVTPPRPSASLAVSGAIALTAVASDFGSLTVTAVDAHGRVGLSLLNTSGNGTSHNASPPDPLVPAAAPTGAPAPGVVLGFPLVLVPYGDIAPVQLVLSDGADAVIVPLDQPEPVHCDAVALAATPAGNDPEDPALPFACLSHGALQVGRLIAGPPDA